MDDGQQRTRRWGWPQITVVVFVAVAMIGAAVPTFHPVAVRAGQAETAGNCRQIITALKLFAGDHDGKYTDAAASAQPTTSNQAFRILFRGGYIDDERIFGARLSKFIPDNIIGDAPDFPKALEAGENHWAMTRGLTDSSDALAPLVFENPVSVGWPPVWNVDAAGKKERGRAWRGGKIIVGSNYSSVHAIKLEATRGSSVGAFTEANGKDFFTAAMKTGEFLDIEE